MTTGQQKTHGEPLWLRVARREIRMRTRSKALWISTGAVVALIVAGVLALHAFSGRTTTYRVAVTDRPAAQLVAAARNAQDAGGSRIEAKEYPDRAAAEEAVRGGHVDALLLSPGGTAASADGWTLEAKDRPDAALQAGLGQAVAVTALGQNAQQLGIPLSGVLHGTELKPVALGHGSGQDGYRYGVTFAFGLLFFLSCQLFGTAAANSVVEEKESRVVEVLLAAIPVRALLAGKVAGNVVLGIAQMALFTGTALSTAALVGGVPQLGAIAGSSGWFLLFYVVGFTTVCCLFAGLGALASRTQDVQAATAPLQLVVTATYMCSIMGKGAVVTVASFVPIATTVTMPARIFAGHVPWWQVVCSLAGAVAFAAVTLRVAGRAYRSSVLRTGARISLLASLRADRTAAVPQGLTTAGTS
ncbi:ABC transporter permease [Kitasatospora sp. NPDC002227]|uniref:ABC transporter permease n=1 Tax=Kitasatospora sp. NPDC002227 TaxID=3154773 RepID=UPI003325787D